MIVLKYLEIFFMSWQHDGIPQHTRIIKFLRQFYHNYIARGTRDISIGILGSIRVDLHLTGVFPDNKRSFSEKTVMIER